MKTYSKDDRISALCHKDGRVMATFDYKDVPFRDGSGVVKQILVGVCEVCEDAIVIPQQSTSAIASAREMIDIPTL